VASLNVKNKLLTNGSNTHAQNSVRNNPFKSEPTSQLHKNGFLRRGELGELYMRYDIVLFACFAECDSPPSLIFSHQIYALRILIFCDTKACQYPFVSNIVIVEIAFNGIYRKLMYFYNLENLAFLFELFNSRYH